MKADDIKRAEYLMRIAANFIHRYAGSYQTYYDEAFCDGLCLADDLRIAAACLIAEGEQRG